MLEKDSTKKILDFDDTMLPVNRITAERSEQIEKILMPRLEKALDKLRIEKPHLFKSTK